MGYPVSTPSAGTTPSRASALARRTAASAFVAGGLYLAGYYLPLVSDGDSSGMWIWVVPALLAVVAGVVAFVGKGVAATAAGTAAGGLVTGVAGITAYELIIVHKLIGDSGPSKGIGFWAMAAAAGAAVSAGLSVIAGAKTGEGKCQQGLSLAGAAMFVGVPLAILLPADGFNPLRDIDDGLIKFGLVLWALLPPLLAVAATLSRSTSGVAFAAGVALAHLGSAVAMMQSDDGSSGFTGSFGTGHDALFQWTALGALVFTAAALAGPLSGRTAAATEAATVASSAAGGGPGQWAADPYGRHQYRWYDGAEWTAQVSDHGVVSQDPPVQSPPTPAPVPRDQWLPPQG
jgi:hypothetical protein